MSLDKPKVMGILNITPDSFYEASRVYEEDSILAKAELMLNEGADFLDIGGYSTRPGAKEISTKEETERVTKAIESIKRVFPECIISIDSFRASVAKAAVETGAGLINDVSGGNLDREMFATVAALRVPYILMHMRGTPQTMHSLANYNNLVLEVYAELQQKTHTLKQLGISDLIIDPGFGFAKTLEQNYTLLKNLSYFQRLGFPLLAGISRKSMIYKALDITPEKALNGTTALNMTALLNGAKILRVHDVKAAKECVQLFNQLNG